MSTPVTFEQFAARVGTFASTLENVAIDLMDGLGTTPQAYQAGMIQYAAEWLRSYADQAERQARLSEEGGAR